MKITIYELLGLIKDSKAPKKIIYDSHIYEYLKNGCVLDDFNYFSITNGLLYNTIDFENHLNEEVEVLEEVEDKEYEDIEELSYKYVNTYGNISQHRKSEEPLIVTINALIRNQKYILEQLNKEENNE